MEDGFLASTRSGLSVSDAPESIEVMSLAVPWLNGVGAVQFVTFFIQRVKSPEATEEEHMA